MRDPKSYFPYWPFLQRLDKALVSNLDLTIRLESFRYPERQNVSAEDLIIRGHVAAKNHFGIALGEPVDITLENDLRLTPAHMLPSFSLAKLFTGTPAFPPAYSGMEVTFQNCSPYGHPFFCPAPLFSTSGFNPLELPTFQPDGLTDAIWTWEEGYLTRRVPLPNGKTAEGTKWRLVHEEFKGRPWSIEAAPRPGEGFRQINCGWGVTDFVHVQEAAAVLLSLTRDIYEVPRRNAIRRPRSQAIFDLNLPTAAESVQITSSITLHHGDEPNDIALTVAHPANALIDEALRLPDGHYPGWEGVARVIVGHPWPRTDVFTPHEIAMAKAYLGNARPDLWQAFAGDASDDLLPVYPDEDAPAASAAPR